MYLLYETETEGLTSFSKDTQEHKTFSENYRLSL